MVIISILPFELYCELTNKRHLLQPLVGNETIYPECFSESLISFFMNKTRDFENMRNYYFRVTKTMDEHKSVYLQPKYTHDTYDLTFHYLVVVSDEVYKQSFGQNDYFFDKGSLSDFHLETVYDILNVDMLELTKLGGDYPQNSSIDVLLKDFFESSTIMNLGQEFTLTFNCNAYLFKNYITFKVNGIVYKSDKLDDFSELNEFSELDNFNEIACSITHPYSDAIDIIAIKPYKNDAIDVGLVANNEVKIKFLEDEDKLLDNDERMFIDKMPLQKAKVEKLENPNKDVPEIFKTKGLQLDSNSNQNPLSKEEIRRLRTKKFG